MNASRWATVFASFAAIGCAGDDSNPSAPSTTDASVSDVAQRDAPGLDAPSGDAEPPPLPIALVRVANWSPDSPGIDVCIAPHGSSAFQGPLLAAEGATLDAGAQVLVYPGVSAYLQVPPGHYDARAVAGGATDCNAGIGPDLTSLGPLAVGNFATVALLGSAHRAGGASKLQLAGFMDDGLATGKVALRFINAAGSMGAVDFGKGTAGATFSPFFKGVAFGTAGSIADAGGVDGAVVADSHGYAALSALSAATLSAHATGATTDALVVSNVSIAAGAVVTAALLDTDVGALDGGAALQLLECVDNAGTVGLASSCAVLPR